MQKTCVQCSSAFKITDDDLVFYNRISPTYQGKTYAFPPPSHCPDCRQQRRLAFCNELNLYPSTCNLCKKFTISQFHSESDMVVYCRSCWHSDKWSAIDYGEDVDFSRPFFEQWYALKRATPSLALDVQGDLENSEYIHYAGSSKNCYLIMHADFCEDCLYGYGFKKNTSCMDGFYNLHCELCFDCIDVHNCYGLIGSQDCHNCSNSAFLRDCTGCQSCFLCVGLKDKQYCFENVQLTKKEYEDKIAEKDLSSYPVYQGMHKKRKELERKHHFKATNGYQNEVCSGDHLYRCKNVQNSFDCEDNENGKYLYQIVLGAKNNYDIYQYGTNLQESCECTITGENSYHIICTLGANMNCSDLLYCWYMETSKDCFGCANMTGARYCILNKQYTKDDYEALVPKIIEHMQTTGEWGQFPSINYSLFGYNKTTAQLYYPLTKEEARQQGWHWDESETPAPKVKKIIDAAQLPNSSKDVPDDILHWAIRCAASGKPFKIQSLELRLIRQQNLPIPRLHPLVRHQKRFEQRNPRIIWIRSCAQCAKDMQTTYAPDRPEIVYCEECYLKEVY